ncbi:PREDICTED: LOW QUALITY PROTEIN: ankyrin repeat domain-containing protein 60 [Miniopterus natalensis]|uniref:LOW QUALITY PROTEIN: ankyrin repeat domain-containing protein 60 n=1 Tax=Miniopterus natalensis TaxID=291302 RepID=UPI0007A6DAA5|nr:PREDICTED: LOW QUALITY PROTEIN: ankyrin repeat domain-containing protein 60 [Miniopterus natalensis]
MIESLVQHNSSRRHYVHVELRLCSRRGPSAHGAGDKGGGGDGAQRPREVGITHVGDQAPRALTHSGDLQAVSLALDSTPDVFVMQVLLEDTGEMFTVTNCRSDMTVRELKEELDLIVGIPLNLHRLQYLDQGVLMDDTTLKFHDVIPGGIISLCVWRYDGWTDLVLAAVEGDTSKLSCLGVTEDSLHLTANLHYLGKKQWKKWVHQRAFVALYIASHRGHADVVQYLLEHGADCFGRSPMGRTPLHVATAMGQSDCISLLLLHGASIHAKDAKGMTPKTIAHQLNRRQDEQRMPVLLDDKVPKGLTDLNLNKAFQGGKSGSGSKEMNTT